MTGVLWLAGALIVLGWVAGVVSWIGSGRDWEAGPVLWLWAAAGLLPGAGGAIALLA